MLWDQRREEEKEEREEEEGKKRNSAGLLDVKVDETEEWNSERGNGANE